MSSEAKRARRHPHARAPSCGHTRARSRDTPCATLAGAVARRCFDDFAAWRQVIGQDAAIAAVSDCVRQSRAGLLAHDRPMGVFLFCGPSGVGKTQLSKALARQLFDSEAAMVRVDMSE
jgi:hypothetical protein